MTKVTKALSFHSNVALFLLCFLVVFCQLQIDTTVERGDSSFSWSKSGGHHNKLLGTWSWDLGTNLIH